LADPKSTAQQLSIAKRNKKKFQANAKKVTRKLWCAIIIQLLKKFKNSP
jgi:hypothetical protein